MLTQNGQPLTLYHGTCSEFELFRPLSHFGTRQAAEQIVARPHIAYDRFNNDSFEQKCAKASQQLREIMENRKKGITPQKPVPRIIPVYLRINNPLVLPDIHGHDMSDYKNIIFRMLMCRQWGDESLLYQSNRLEQNNGLNRKTNFNRLCQSADFMSEIRFIFNHPFDCPYGDVLWELAAGGFYPLAIKMEQGRTVEEINRTHLAAQRMIRFFEERGYDGIQYRNEHEDKNSISYICFRSEQVVRLDRQLMITRPTSRPKNESILQKIRERVLPFVKPTPLTEQEMEMLYFFELEVGHKNSALMPRLKPTEAIRVTSQPLFVSAPDNENERG